MGQGDVVVSVQEWRTVELPGMSLSEDDRRLAVSLGSSARLVVEELRDGVRVSARSWVGVVRFTRFEVRVEPKLAGGNLGLVDMLDYASGLGGLWPPRTQRLHWLEAGDPSLFDVIAALLANACERLVRGGILSDYREVEDDLPVVRGRLLAQRQLTRRFGRVDRLECRYDEYVTDVLENQILAAALTLCRQRVSDATVALRVRRLQKLFCEVCSHDGLDLARARAEVCYNRMSDAYREPHSLSWLVADGLGVKDLFQGRSARCFAFLLDMNRLFECFLTKWLRWVFAGSRFRVHAQRQDRSIVWDADSNTSFKRVVPDILIEPVGARAGRLPVDAKYKLYEAAGVPSADIYQAFLYAFAYAPEPEARVPAAFLFYPASGPSGGSRRLLIRRHRGGTGATIVVAPVHIPTALAEARTGRPGALADQVRAAMGLHLAASLS